MDDVAHVADTNMSDHIVGWPLFAYVFSENRVEENSNEGIPGLALEL
jgi:hypothetical protein